MKLATLAIATGVTLVGFAQAQTHDILAANHSFTDSVTGSPLTTVDLGTTIRWTAGANAPHTLTNGLDSSAANAGLLFQQTLLTGESFSYKPAAAGVIPYFCAEHEVHGMKGTLLINPLTDNHVVHAHHHSFFDATDGTNVTVITLGETVQWYAGGNAPHTLSSGSGSSDPQAGALFQSAALFQGDSFQYTPTTTGTIDYFCQEHEVHGMNGKIVVMSPPTYPGSGDDLTLTTQINGVPNAADIKSIQGGDSLVLTVGSPEGSLVATPLVIAVELFMTGNPPVSNLAGIHFSPATATLIAAAGFVVVGRCLVFLDTRLGPEARCCRCPT